MPRMAPSEIEQEDTVMIECRIARTATVHTGRWDTRLELMGVALLFKHTA